MLKRRLQSAGGRVGETERACFGAFFLHCTPKSDSRICLNCMGQKMSSLPCVINYGSAAQPIVICLNVI
jgi:hypothetical protein